MEIKVVFIPVCRLSCWRPTLWTRRTSWLTGRPSYPGVGCAATAPPSSSRTASASAITSRKSDIQLDSRSDLKHFARSYFVVIDPDPGETCELFFKHLGQRTQVFRIHDILVRIRLQILGSVQLFADPAPDTALFVSDFQDSNKNNQDFFQFFLLITFCRYIYRSLQR